MFKIGFIDYYLDEWHANNYPAWIKKATNGEMQVTHAWGMTDIEGKRTNKEWCEQMGITQCQTMEEVIDICDGLIVLSPNNPEMHLELCEKPLKSKKPTYVDKTFAPDLETAKKIFAFAEESGTPCYTSSALRYASSYAKVDTSKVKAVHSWGPNDMEIYSIHQIEPICMLMKTTAKRVMYLPGDKNGTLNIEFDDGRIATMTHFVDGSDFVLNVAGEPNMMVNAGIDFWDIFIKVLIDFYHDHEIKVPHQETLNVIGLRSAGITASKNPWVWIDVEK